MQPQGLQREKEKERGARAIPYESLLSICIIWLQALRKPLPRILMYFSGARLAVDLYGNSGHIADKKKLYRVSHKSSA